MHAPRDIDARAAQRMLAGNTLAHRVAHCCALIVAIAVLSRAHAHADDAAINSTHSVSPTSPAKPRHLFLQGGAFGVAAERSGSAHSGADWGYGVGFALGLGWGQIPLFIGGDFFVVRWGRSASKVEVDLGDRLQQATLTKSDQGVLWNIWLRAQPQTWRVRPYVDGLIGANVLETKFSLALDGGAGSTGRVAHTAFMPTWGFGAGIDVLVAQRSAQGMHAYVFAGARWLYGRDASLHAALHGEPSHSTRVGLSADTTAIMLGLIIR